MAHNQHTWSPKTKQKAVWWFATFAPNSLLTQKLLGRVLYRTLYRKLLGTYNVIFRLGESEGFSSHHHESKGSLLKSSLWRVAYNSYWTGICVTFAGGLPLPSVWRKTRLRVVYLEVIPEISNKSGGREKEQGIQYKANIKVTIASNGSTLLGCPMQHRRASGLSLEWGKTEYLSISSLSVLTESYLPSSFPGCTWPWVPTASELAPGYQE